MFGVPDDFLGPYIGWGGKRCLVCLMIFLVHMLGREGRDVWCA